MSRYFLLLCFSFLGNSSFLMGINLPAKVGAIGDLESKKAFKEANLKIETLIAHFEKEQNVEQVITFKLRMARNLRKLGDNKEAIALLKAIEKLNQKNNVKRLLFFCENYFELGKNYDDLMLDSLALSYFKKSLEYKEQVKHKTAIVKEDLFYQIGCSYFYLDKIEQATTYFKKVIAGQENVSLGSKASTHYFLGGIMTQKGAFDKAKDYYKNAIYYYKESNSNQSNLAIAYSDYSGVLFSLGAFDRAVEAEKSGIEILENINDKTARGQSTLGDRYINLGDLYLRLGNHAPSESANHKALKIFQNLKTADSRAKMSIILNNFGLIYKGRGLYEKALLFLKQATEINERSGNRRSLKENYENIASCYHELKDYPLALENYQVCLRQIDPSFEPTNVFDNPTPSAVVSIQRPYLLSVLLLKVQTLQDKYNSTSKPEDLRGILDTYKIIERTIALIRRNNLNVSFKVRLSAQTKAYIDLKIDFITNHFEEEKIAELFKNLEENKSLTLLESIIENKAMRMADLPATLRVKEKKLTIAITNLEKQLIQEGVDKMELAKLREQRLNKLMEQEELILEIEQKYPAYYRRKYDINITSIPQLQEKLSANQSLVSYFIGKQAIYAFLIEKEKAKLIPIPKDFSLSEYVQKMRSGILNPFYERNNYNLQAMNVQYAEYAYLLYQKLIAPLGTLKEEVIIIPDGELGYIPFDALLQKLPKEPKYFATHEYFGKNYQISNNYSATLWLEMSARTAFKGSVLGVAPTFPQNPAFNEKLSQSRRADLWHLNFNESEVEGIYQLFGGKKLLANGATIKEFEKYAPNYSILHLATHALLDDENIEFSYLAFTKMADSLAHKMYLKDLYELELNAQMVVLSACETGLGALKKGEGIYSLARGFAHTGVKSIVNSLWSIDDAPSSKLMVNFYKKLSEGLPKDRALQLAKKEYYLNTEEHRKAHPFYWAAFVPIGDMSPLQLDVQTQLNTLIGLNFSKNALISMFLLTLLLVGYKLWNFQNQVFD